MNAFVGILGIIALFSIALLLSNNRKAIRLRTVGGAFAIQAGLGLFILYIPAGRDFLYGLSQGISNIISYGNEGVSFLFGGLVSDDIYSVLGDGGFIFAFRVLPVIIFFSALISVLYYLGIMQKVINFLGTGLQKLLGTSKSESLSATANVFVGQVEAPLVVAPYIPTMTQSQLFAIMCGGLASVAGEMLAGYASLGVPIEYLIAASFMAAPGGLLFAKIIMPETEEVNDDIDISEHEEQKPTNIIDAAAAGASSGLELALGVGAMLVAFIGLIALVNGMIGGVGNWFGMPELTLELILGYVFAPIAWVIGVPTADITVAGSFIGQKLIINEFVAYLNFGEYLKPVADVQAAGLEALQDKSKIIISFALCGFANLSSIAILLGGLGGIAPSRRHDIARFGLKAVAAGTLSNLMSATLAGIFLSL